MKNTEIAPASGRRRGRSLVVGSHPVAAEPLESRRLFDGLTGQYFNRVDQTELVTTRLDPQVAFSWLTSPTAGVNADHFSVRWTGEVQAPTTENYTFSTTADDGVRLWVDGRLLVDNWVNQGPTQRSGTLSLEAGKRYDVRMDYYDYDSTAQVNLSWSTATMSRTTIPAANLFPGQTGLAATYFNGTDFSQPALQRRDATANFLWLTGTPDPATITADGFAVRWSGYIVPEFSQTYTFRAPTQAGASTLRLRVDGRIIIDPSSAQASGRIPLEAGKRYAISLDYADTSGPAGVNLQWQSPSQPLQTIPNSRLIAGAATSIPSRRVTYTNPVINADQPDPDIIKADGVYWMTHTVGGPNSGWPLWRSLDGVHWTYQKDLLNSANKQSWMNGNYWAPEIHKVGTKFILTGTSTDSRTGQLVVVMASSSTIDGTYAVRTEPIVTDSVADIDSDIFIDDDGTPYLVWKRDSDAHTGQHGSIRIRQLDASGVNFAAGSSTTVILDNETGGWENFLAEAPFLVRRDDAYYLFYSGAQIDTTYKLGVARSTSLTQMFTRNPSNPIIANDVVWGGPGHGGLEVDNDGNLWHLYHARLLSNPNAGRVQVLDPVVWTASGWPSFNGNGVSYTPQAGPKVDALSGAGVLSVVGDLTSSGQADTFKLVRSGADGSMLDVYVNGVLSSSTPYAEVQTIVFDGKAGDDSLALDNTYGNVIPGGGATFIGGAGTGDTVRVIVPTTGLNAVRYLANGQMVFGTGLFSYSGVEKLSLTGGDSHFAYDLAGIPLDVTAGKVTFDVDQRLGGLSVLSTASVALAATDRTLVTTKLVIATTGQLDLTNGTLVVDYASTDASPLSDIAAALTSGRNGGTWTGTSGIVSTTVAANTIAGVTLGYGEAASIASAFPATFGNTTIDATSVLVRYTLAGDTNLNRSVDFDDLLTLAKNYTQSGKTYAEGNVNDSADGSVDFDDLLILAKAYGGSLPLAAAATMASVTPTRAKRNSAAADVVA